MFRKERLWFPQTKLPRAMALQYGEKLQLPSCTTFLPQKYYILLRVCLFSNLADHMTVEIYLWYGDTISHTNQSRPKVLELMDMINLLCLSLKSLLRNSTNNMSLFLFLTTDIFFRVPLFSVYSQYNFFALQRIISEAIGCPYRSRWVSLIQLYSYTSAYQS